MLESQTWDVSYYAGGNSMLSIMALSPIFINILNINLLGIFKYIYPLILSVLPVILYIIIKKQTNDKIAFFSGCFFIFFAVFFGELLGLLKQQIAEIFFALIILTLVDVDLPELQKKFLMILFGFSLVVSHYGLSYIFLFFLIVLTSVTLCLDLLVRKGFHKNHYFNTCLFQESISHRFSVVYVIIIGIFAIFWFAYTSGSASLDTIIRIGDQITSNIISDFLNPSTTEGLRVMSAATQGGLHEVYKIINYLNQLLIIVGFISVIAGNRYKFNRDFLILSGVAIVILFLGVIIPYFALSINMTRLYHITLILLSPFAVMGAIFALNKILPMINKRLQTPGTCLKIISVYLVIFMLFSTGFIYETAEGYSGSISLSQSSIKNQNVQEIVTRFYSSFFYDTDIISASWISHYRDSEFPIYSDIPRYYQLLTSAGHIEQNSKRLMTNNIKKLNGYLYLGYPNIIYNVMSGPNLGQYWDLAEIKPIIDSSDLLYSNGYSGIYLRDY
jgi:uncharacterized membrane protein